MAVTIPIEYGQMTVRWRFTGAVRDSVVVIGYNPPNVDPPGNAEILHGLLTAVGRPCNSAQMGLSWNFVGLRCTEMTDQGPLSADRPSQVAGSMAIATMPPNCSILIRKATLAGGRRNRGRLFVPPLQPAENTVDELGNIGTTQLTALQTMWGALRTDMITAGFPWVIFHSQPPFNPTTVTSITVERLIATQRRRLRR